jgi:tetratricopeptide (TPR) repeat protein
MEVVLVGRSRELAVLDEGVRAAVAGQCAVLLLTGEAGIGKTRLLEELGTRMERAGGRAVWGRTWVGLAPAFWPWTQVLGTLAERDDPAPELVGLDDRADASSRLARFDATSAFLVRRAATRPLALLLDDVHAADASSLLLLEFLARHVRSAHLLVAITARDGEATADVEAALARIRRDAKRIVVGRLDATEVARLVGGRVPPQLVGQLHELSAGNPLFVEELVACIAAHGDLSGLARITGVRAVIRDRIARLPETTTSTLVAAALAGREFRGAVIADVEGISASEIERRLDPAVRLAVVTRSGLDRYRFSHGLVAESLAEAPPEDVVRLHGKLADALERLEGDDAASAIAHHRLSIAHVDPPAAIVAAAAAERAARVALVHLAFEDAAALLDRALAVLPDDPATHKQRTGLMCVRAEALQHAGEHARARELCDRAADLARGAGDGVLLARIALARGIEFQFGATDRVLVDMLQEALATMPDGDSSLRARCLARLAAAEQPAPDPRKPIATAREAIAMARRIGDRRTRLDVIHVAFAALVEFVPPAELDVLLRELFVLATSPGDRLIALRNRLRHCFVALDLADRAAFDAAVATHAELAETVGMARWLWPAKLIASMVASFEGRFAEGRLAADEAEAIGTGDPQGERTFAYHRWATAWTQTAPSAALARRVAERYEYARAAMQLVAALDDGDLAALPAALAATEALVANDDITASAMVDAVAAIGDRQRARQLFAQLAPSSGRVWVVSMTGFVLQDFADRCLLVLATVLEDWAAVDRYGRAAAALAARLDAPPWLARIHADWATALDRCGERARADHLWLEARVEAARLDMPGLLARCERARRDQPPPATVAIEPPSEPDPSEPDPREPVSVAREGDLWIVRGRGCIARVRNSRGMQMLARLVADPGREIHALDLVGDGGGVDTGDAGELLDPKAKAAYRKRMAELTEELEEAEAWRDPLRAERARTELETLARELQRAVGLGGRDRMAGAARERARTNAQRRLAFAIQQIRNAAPALGEHLATAVSTGTFCVYNPG